MQETRYAIVNGEKIPVLISDENEALLAAKAAGRAIVGLWREDAQGDEWCVADTLIADMEVADEEVSGTDRKETAGTAVGYLRDRAAYDPGDRGTRL